MRTKEELFDLEEISTLYQFLYFRKENFVIINNGLTDLKIYMDDNFNVFALNLSYPELPPLCYNDMLSVPNLLGIIDYLKRDVKHVKFKNIFPNRWAEIKNMTGGTVGLNKWNMRDKK